MAADDIVPGAGEMFEELLTGNINLDRTEHGEIIFAPEQRAFHDVVTGACQASGVNSEPSRTGVCVIRITAQGGRMLITLRENADVERIPADRTYKMTDVSEAIRAVHEFLTSFVAASRAD